MSIKHPIIAITGSSGAGTTSVKRTFEQIFRREKIDAVYIEGDAFHRWNRAEMREQMKEAAARGDHHYSHFGEDANLFHELEKTFRDYSETGVCRARSYVHDADEAEIHGAPPGTFTAWRDFEPGSDLLFYEGLHGAVVTDSRQRRPTCRSQDRRRSGHQSRMDPEAASRQGVARLHDRGGHRHDPAPHAGLHQLHLSAIHSHGYQLPARADRRHVQSVHRALDPDARRVDGRHPLPRSARHRFPVSPVDDSQQLHEPRQFDRDPRAASSTSRCSSS